MSARLQAIEAMICVCVFSTGGYPPTTTWFPETPYPVVAPRVGSIMHRELVAAGMSGPELGPGCELYLVPAAVAGQVLARLSGVQAEHLGRALARPSAEA